MFIQHDFPEIAIEAVGVCVTGTIHFLSDFKRLGRGAACFKYFYEVICSQQKVRNYRV